MLRTIFATLAAIAATTLLAEAAVQLDKNGDAALQAMIAETVPKFNQLTYGEGDPENRLDCNLLLPEGYPGARKYPLVVFIADDSTVGKETDAPLRQGYGGIIWAAEEHQARHKCIVLVPQYPQKIVDDRSGKTAATYIDLTESLIRALSDGFQVDKNRIYLTGQSMGCMALMAIAAKHPELFAAELFVAGQGELPELGGLTKEEFFHVVAEGDVKASSAQKGLIERFREAGIPVSNAFEWDARMMQDGFEKAVRVILSGKPKAKFVRFIKGTVQPNGNGFGATEHEYSFDAAYKIDALREWLFMQGKPHR